MSCLVTLHNLIETQCIRPGTGAFSSSLRCITADGGHFGLFYYLKNGIQRRGSKIMWKNKQSFKSSFLPTNSKNLPIYFTE